MSISTTLVLASLMGAIAIVNASLMAWLWRFPMVGGVSSAPRLGTNLHRALGYVFILTYLALLVEMVPRVWEYRTGTIVSVVHGALGLFIGVLLAIKIAIIRRFPRYGHRLPWIGGALAATTLTVVALGVVPAWRVTRANVAPELAAGRAAVAAKCTQCHGASIIAAEDEELRKWRRLVAQMQRFSVRMPGKDPILDAEREVAAVYLATILGDEEDEGDEDEDEEGGRRRRRGRGR